MPIDAAVGGTGRGNVEVYGERRTSAITRKTRDAYDNIKTKAHLQMHDDNDLQIKTISLPALYVFRMLHRQRGWGEEASEKWNDEVWKFRKFTVRTVLCDNFSLRSIERVEPKMKSRIQHQNLENLRGGWSGWRFYKRHGLFDGLSASFESFICKQEGI